MEEAHIGVARESVYGKHTSQILTTEESIQVVLRADRR